MKRKKRTKKLVHMKQKTHRLANANHSATIKFSTNLSIILVLFQIPSRICHFAEVS